MNRRAFMAALAGATVAPKIEPDVCNLASYSCYYTVVLLPGPPSGWYGRSIADMILESHTAPEAPHTPDSSSPAIPQA